MTDNTNRFAVTSEKEIKDLVFNAVPYNSRPTIEQQCQSSAIVSHFVDGGNKNILPQASNVLPTTSTVQTLAESQSNVIEQANFNVTPGDSRGPNFSSSSFHGCNFYFHSPNYK